MKCNISTHEREILHERDAPGVFRDVLVNCAIMIMIFTRELGKSRAILVTWTDVRKNIPNQTNVNILVYKYRSSSFLFFNSFHGLALLSLCVDYVLLAEVYRGFQSKFRHLSWSTLQLIGQSTFSVWSGVPYQRCYISHLLCLYASGLVSMQIILCFWSDSLDWHKILWILEKGRACQSHRLNVVMVYSESSFRVWEWCFSWWDESHNERHLSFRKQFIHPIRFQTSLSDPCTGMFKVLHFQTCSQR
jgi:hypothetical protein